MTHWPGIIANSVAFTLIVAALYLYVRALLRGLRALRRGATGPVGRPVTTAAVALVAACAAFFVPAFTLRADPDSHDAERRAAVQSHGRWWSAAALLGGAVPLLTAAGLRRAWTTDDGCGPTDQPPVS